MKITQQHVEHVTCASLLEGREDVHLGARRVVRHHNQSRSHHLHHRNPKVFVPHGVQPHTGLREQRLHVRERGVDFESHLRRQATRVYFSLQRVHQGFVVAVASAAQYYQSHVIHCRRQADKQKAIANYQ